MKNTLLAALFFVAAFAAQAQTTDKRYIEVTGSAETEIAPNIIVLSIRLREFMEGRDKTTLDQLDGEFRAAISKSKLEKDKLVLTDVNLYAYQRRRTDRETFAQKTYEVTFSKSEEVIAFLENLKTVNVDFLQVARLDHTEMEKYRLQTKIEALKAGEAKASALVAAVGGKRGRPLVIEEVSVDLLPWVPNPQEMRAMLSNTGAVHRGSSDSASEADVPLRMIKLRYEIKARFEIE